MHRRLPLFPLPNVVLFPGMILPLHIFEERYRQMLLDILDNDARFGILLCKEYNPKTLAGKPFNVGTVAEVMEYDRLPDDRMNIVVTGSQRFQVETYDETSKMYLQGQVQWIDDLPDGYVTKKLVGETVAYFQEALRLMHKILNKDHIPPEMPEDPKAISFFIAENLRGSLVLKQELLEMDSTKARLQFEREVLQKMVRAMAVRSQIEDAFRSS